MNTDARKEQVKLALTSYRDERLKRGLNEPEWMDATIDRTVEELDKNQSGLEHILKIRDYLRDPDLKEKEMERPEPMRLLDALDDYIRDNLI